jgi:predicted transglutaminase-like cysteine proteinase
MAISYSRIGGIVLAAMLVLAASGASRAEEAAMPTAGITTQPYGHHQFCSEYPDTCGRSKYSAPLLLTNSLWNLLVKVNGQVNSTVIPRTDMEMWGKKEVWSYPGRYGDCEDYVLEKQRYLEQRGIPASNLLITVVRQPNGDGHAVLTVRTDRGDFVLDNLQPNIELWTRTAYHYLKRQSELNAGRWVSIEDDRITAVGSIR